MQSVHFLNHLLYFGIVSREGFPCRAEMALIFDAAREVIKKKGGFFERTTGLFSIKFQSYANNFV